MSAPIRILLAEDQTMVLALSALLELEPDIFVVACAANGRDALDAVARLALTFSSPILRCP
jgi:two-component system response regulator DesR